MTDLPDIDLKKVNSKLTLKLADLQNQVFQLENLAEQLRDERDEARDNLPVEVAPSEG